MSRVPSTPISRRILKHIAFTRSTSSGRALSLSLFLIIPPPIEKQRSPREMRKDKEKSTRVCACCFHLRANLRSKHLLRPEIYFPGLCKSVARRCSRLYRVYKRAASKNGIKIARPQSVPRVSHELHYCDDDEKEVLKHLAQVCIYYIIHWTTIYISV